MTCDYMLFQGLFPFYGKKSNHGVRVIIVYLIYVIYDKLEGGIFRSVKA